MSDTSTEIAWPSRAMPARLVWDGTDDEGYLRFIGPDGLRAIIAVTHGPDRHDHELARNVWHIDDSAPPFVTVSPSVHFIGRWHSPNPVQFELVDELPGGW